MEKPMKVESIFIDAIYVPDGPLRREADPDKVATIASSIKDVGLRAPITVRYVDAPVTMDGEEVEGAYWLVAGLHRLSAMKALGEESIPADVVEMDDDHATIWECDENLARKELTTDQKRIYLRERKKAWEAIQEARQVRNDFAAVELSDGRKAGPQHQKGFAAETAEKTGLSKRRIEQLLADPKPRLTQSHVAPAEEEEPDMTAMARSDFAFMLRKYTQGQLQEYIDAFADELQRSMAA